MSDTAAFLAGCAVTGVAVLFLMRNDLAISQPRSPQPLQPLSPTPEYSIAPIPVSPLQQDDGRGVRMEAELEQQQDLARTLTDELKRQQNETEDLKNQLDKQQDETEDLRGQLEKQQRDTEVLISQLQEQQRLLDKISDQPVRPTLPVESSSKIQTILIGAAGVILLIVVVGGGLVLVGIILVVIFSSRRRPTRTVHIVHPVPNPYAAFPEQPLLPARPRTRPARQIDLEYYSDNDYD